jgi:hypothetical protein
MTIRNTLIFLAVGAVSVFLAAFVVERSVAAALKCIKLALKSEFTSAVGRLNFVSMILFFVFMFIPNLHRMIADSLIVGGVSQSNDNWIAPAALLGVFFMGSLICVMIIEKRQ